MTNLSQHDIEKYHALFEDAIYEKNTALLLKHADIYKEIFIEDNHILHICKSIDSQSFDLFETLISLHLSPVIIFDAQKLLAKNTSPNGIPILLKIIDLVQIECKESLKERKQFKNEIINQILFDAIDCDNEVIASWCIDNGAKLFDKRFDFQALDTAAENNSKKVFDALIEKGAKLNYGNYLALYKALHYQNYDLFLHILDLNINFNPNITHHLFFDNPPDIHAEETYIKTLPYLKNEFCILDLLISSIHLNYDKAIDVILETGINVNLKKCEALKLVCDKKNIELIKLLLDYNANPSFLNIQSYNDEISTLLIQYPRNSKFKKDLEIGLSTSDLHTKKLKL